MKLYTEEQMKEAIKMALHGFGIGGIEDTIEVVASKFTPIEIPTDEEIWNEGDKEDNNSKHYAFTRGARWMRDKIGGNNE
jgi:hypothetical protein